MEVTCDRCGSVFAPDTSAGQCPDCGYNTRTPFAKLRLALTSHFAIYKQAPWHILKLMVIGALSFWVPDIVWHAIRGSQFDWRDVLALTVVLPVSFFGTYKRLQGRGREETILRWMLLGLWLLGGFLIVLGGFLIMVGASFAGSGFDTSSLQILPISLIPGIVYILAAYDGSLMALIIVTAVSLIIWFARVIGHSSKSR